MPLQLNSFFASSLIPSFLYAVLPPPPSPPPQPTSSPHLPATTIIGVSIGAVAVALALTAIVFCVYWRRRRSRVAPAPQRVERQPVEHQRNSLPEVQQQPGQHNFVFGQPNRAAELESRRRSELNSEPSHRSPVSPMQGPYQMDSGGRSEASSYHSAEVNLRGPEYRGA